MQGNRTTERKGSVWPAIVLFARFVPVWRAGGCLKILAKPDKEDPKKIEITQEFVLWSTKNLKQISHDNKERVRAR